MTSIQIQAATVDRAELILGVLVAAFEQYRQVLDPPSGVFREAPADIRQKLERGGGFVAWDDLSMVGAVLYESHPDYMYLGRLAVLPAYRGRQIATRLVHHVEQVALERERCHVKLGVRLALTGNQLFFERMGYRIISYHSHEDRTEFTYVMMEKTLAT